MGQHNAADVLSSSDIAALIITGGKGRLTPPCLAGCMVQETPQADLHLIPDAPPTHLGLVEIGEGILARLKRLFEERLERAD